MRIGRTAAVTDTGRRRIQNEDAFVCDPPLFAVADGMGGAQAGELASGLAAAAIEERAGGIRGTDAVAGLIQEANARVFERSLIDPTAAGMGTTVTIAVVDEAAGTVVIGHVGDSRAYLVRGGALEQLTADHSLVGELMRSGRLTAEEAATHPHRSVITRVLGTESVVDVDTHTVEAATGDLYLVCSDGLPAMVRDEGILAAILSADGVPSAAAQALIAAANAAGGEDNVTVVLFELVDGEPQPRGATFNGETTSETVASASGPADVQRHGASRGSRWPALLFVLAVALVAALALWWSLGR